MTSSAAKKGSEDLCPKHAGTGLGPNAALEPVPSGMLVETNSVLQGRGADPAVCKDGSIDYTITGASTVTVNSQPAARVGSLMLHGGMLVTGSSNVVIGGPSGGATLGGVDAATKACVDAKNTRTSGATSQSYGNCGLEAHRNTINRDRAAQGLPPVTEDELLQRATGMGVAGNDPVNKPWAYGATNHNDRIQVLQSYGIDAGPGSNTPDGLQQDIADRKGVSASVYPFYYWPASTGAQPGWQHEVAVTGVEYGADGKVAAYFINDTGLGACGLRVPASNFERALMPFPSTVTKTRHW